jgi:hypothetical protein
MPVQGRPQRISHTKPDGRNRVAETVRPGAPQPASAAAARRTELPRAQTLLAIGLVALFVVGSLTLRPGHPWTGDFALYIAHAINIVQGVDYHATGYLYNPQYAEVGPPSYPPVAPLILAGVQRLFGLDWWAMKAALYGFWIAALALIYLLHARVLDPRQALVLTAVVAGSPYLWQLREEIGSEFPFLVFLYAALLLIDTDVGRSGPRRVAKIVAQALLFYLCYATRTVGIILVPVLLTRDLLHRRLSLDTGLTLAGFALLWLIHGQIFGDGVDYSDQFQGITAWTFLHNFSLYVSMLWPYLLGYLYDPDLIRRSVRIAVGLTFAFLAFVGYAAKLLGFIDHGRLRIAPRNAGVLEIFTAGYLVMISIAPFTQAPRYTVPLFPLIIGYAYRGGMLVLRPLVRSAGVRQGLLLAAVAAFYVTGHARLDTGPRGASVTDPEPAAMFAYIREQTPDDAVLIFTRPRIMALLGERRTSIWPYHERFGEEAAWCYFSEIGASHLVIHDQRVWSPLPDYLERQRLEGAPHLRPVFDNRAFAVYEILELPGCGEH